MHIYHHMNKVLYKTKSYMQTHFNPSPAQKMKIAWKMGLSMLATKPTKMNSHTMPWQKELEEKSNLHSTTLTTFKGWLNNMFAFKILYACVFTWEFRYLCSIT